MSRSSRFARWSRLGLVCSFLPLTPPPPAPTASAGDTAWLLTATALVLFMTLPGLAAFYAGLVRTKNVLSVLMQCFAICCIVSIIWLVGGFGLAFGDGGGIQGFIGSFSRSLLGHDLRAGV